MDRNDLMRRAFDFTMAAEGLGAYTDDPGDPGGPTKYGVALAYNRAAIPDKDGNGVIDAADVRLLTEADALAIYANRYWRPHIREEYPPALAFLLADMVFNPGPGAAHRLLQKALNTCGASLHVDGKVGPKTLAAVAGVVLPRLLHALTAKRLAYYLSRKGWPRYGRGWTARSVLCLAAALRLAGEDA